MKSQSARRIAVATALVCGVLAEILDEPYRPVCTFGACVAGWLVS